jgi:hypothetical protein
MTTRTTDVRERLGGTALIVAPLVILAGALAHPMETSDARRQLDIVAGGLNRWYVAHLLYIAGFVLLVPAVLSLGRRLRTQASRLELWGTGLAVLGLFSSAGIVAVEGFGGWQLAQAGDRSTAAAVFERMTHSAGIVVPFGILGVSLSAGLIVLAVGLGRTGSAAPWMAWTLAAGAVLVAVGLSAVLEPALVAGIGCLAVAMGAAGLADLGRTASIASPLNRPTAPFGASS